MGSVEEKIPLAQYQLETVAVGGSNYMFDA